MRIRSAHRLLGQVLLRRHPDAPRLAAATAAAGRTSIVIAHRLDQAASADRVLVMESGRIVEDGALDELVRRGGRYAELWAAWSTR